MMVINNSPILSMIIKKLKYMSVPLKSTSLGGGETNIYDRCKWFQNGFYRTICI